MLATTQQSVRQLPSHGQLPESTGAVVNFTTGQFPATTGLASAGGGDSTIETDVTLAQPCFAPIVFVTNRAARPGSR